MKKVVGIAFVLVLLTAVASFADSITNAHVLDLLNVAHTKLEAGDKPGAKAELNALAAKLATSTHPLHKSWRRQVQWIVMKITIGMSGSADSSLHDLLKEVSTANAGTPPGQPSPVR